MELTYCGHTYRETAALQVWKLNQRECGDMTVEKAEDLERLGYPTEVHDGHLDNAGHVEAH